MRVHAGSVILEPTLNGNDLGEIAKKGVWLAKAGFGAFKTAFEYGPLVAAARAHGMITTCHTGGSSIPGSGAITGDHLLAMKPHVSFHVNGGPTAMPDKDFERIIVEGDMALQVCTAGNLRTTLLCATLARRHNEFDRLIVATDTPTGSGVMPLGMLYTIAHLASLADIAPELAIAAATGSNARVYGLESASSPPARRRTSCSSTPRTEEPKTRRSPRSATATSPRSAPWSRPESRGSWGGAATRRAPHGASESSPVRWHGTFRARGISWRCDNTRRASRARGRRFTLTSSGLRPGRPRPSA